MLADVDARRGELLLRELEQLLRVRRLPPRVGQLQLLVLLGLPERVEGEAELLVESGLVGCERLLEPLLAILMLLCNLGVELLELVAKPRLDAALEEDGLLVHLHLRLEVLLRVVQRVEALLLLFFEGLLLLGHKLVEERLAVEPRLADLRLERGDALLQVLGDGFGEVERGLGV